MQKLAIVGGGISGLTLAYYLQNDYEITVFEKEKWGGKAYTQKVDKYLLEEGVNGFLSNSPKTLELCEEIGINPIKANENSKIRYIYDDKLYQIPLKPIEFLKSDILSFFGKLRVAMEFFVEPICDREETVAEFATRRLGKEFNRRMMTPMLAGIYASTPEKTSMNAAFPKLKKIECEYGSLFKGMIKLKRGGQPSGELHSFEWGMSEFIEKLISKTKANFVEKEIIDIDELDEFDKVVIATPSYNAAEILAKYENLSGLLKKIEYNPVAIVGFDYEEIKPVCFGILTVKDKSLGILMDKYIFPNRNAIRVMVGGARYPEIKNMSEEEIIKIAENDVAKITGAQKPSFKWIKIHKNAIPNYSLGHQKLVDEIMKEAEKIGIYLTGNAYKGVSFNDCIKNSYELAQKLKESNV
ncbi:protoporphyrinogen oxidase [Caminibacter pacificus]|uniref:Coproporphyrinogen III oxidase n=1 Tax=Caminibacter pacificus TaxID=1424653 RepID=A0AAJ4RD60_9BACT|nr:protoporphyrinogen oxidase [Caminibacter pacificus]QCI28677.1 protoporphyrinogen oxidase [Caminibacter pacificus]ROR40592.1 oxygen-dependent protoporphyrinogen oxidase [Caminibacter pacificus]